MENENVEVKGQVTSDKSVSNFGTILLLLLIVAVVSRISYEMYKSKRQKTRNPRERRMYVGSRARPSFTQPEPTIYVSPANLPPPPKYECMAPPSYEEVVGIHYPQYQQPITTPIVTALSLNNSVPTPSNFVISSATVSNATGATIRNTTITNNATVTTATADAATVITVSANERRASVTVASS